jgi:serine/threonine protein phosphatase PrpC
MKIDVASISQRGGREKNQDYVAHLIHGLHAGFVVADGLGGHEGGEVASQLVAKQMLKSFRENVDLTQLAMEQMMELAQADLRFHKEQQPHYKDMCSTATMLRLGFATDDFGNPISLALWAHVGDSRIYHFRDGKLLTQTKDHSVPQALVNAGEIQLADIRNHEDRNRLLRALGMEHDVRASISEPIHIEPGDTWLLCTDGFWEYIVESEMEHLLAEAEHCEAWLASMEQLILSRATGEHDNYSALAVRVSSVGQQPSLQVEKGKRPPPPFKKQANSVKDGPVWHDFSDEEMSFFSWRSWKLWLSLLLFVVIIVGSLSQYEFKGNIVYDWWHQHTPEAERQLKTTKKVIPNKQELKTISWKIGDVVQFGKYREQPLTWRVIQLDETGNPLLFSEYIVTDKAFDAAGEKHSGDRKSYGSNYYADSNLRQWLNSAEEQINWKQNAPLVSGLQEGRNPYENEPGFLAEANFSSMERGLIVPRKHMVILTETDQGKRTEGGETHLFEANIDKAVANGDRAYKQEVTDQVFLLSIQDVVFVKNLIDDQTEKFTKDFLLGKKQGASKFPDYWLNSAQGDTNHQVRIVDRYREISNKAPNKGEVGVRPALVLDAKASASHIASQGTGELDKPYVIQTQSKK